MNITPAIERHIDHIQCMRLSRLIRPLCMALWFAALSACATGPVTRDPKLQISGMVMENQTQMYLSAVSLMVPATGGFVTCGTITPGTQCSTTFPEVEYSGNPVEISWRQGGQVHTSGLFHLQIPTGIDKRKPVEVRVVITGPDTAGAIFVQRPE